MQPPLDLKQEMIYVKEDLHGGVVFNCHPYYPTVLVILSGWRVNDASISI